MKNTPHLATVPKDRTAAIDASTTTRTVAGILAALLCTGLSVLGSPVTKERAAEAAATFLAKRYSAPAGTTGLKSKSPQAIQQVFPLTEGGRTIGFVATFDPSGYVLLSADDEAPPIKLHTDSGAFDSLPPAFLKVIQLELAEDLNTLGAMKSLATPDGLKYREQWSALAPTAKQAVDLSAQGATPPGTFLLTTAWNQDFPYNWYTPIADGTNQAPAGCAAIALSQILRFYQKPAAVLEDHTYTDSIGACQGTHFMRDAGLGAYDWSNMPNEILPSSPEEEKKAIGQLIYHAAVAVDSDFEGFGTAADSGRIPEVLRRYFGYSCGEFVAKTSFTSAEWYNMIAAELSAGRPIYYTLRTADLTNSHAAVCDGYQNGNDIHLNMGWINQANNTWYNVDSVSGPNPQPYTIHRGLFGITPFSKPVDPPKPFVPSKGTYNGLLYEAGGVAQRSSGNFTIATTAKSALSGSMQIGGMRYSISGYFLTNGHFTGAIKRGKLSLFHVQLQVDLADPDRIAGTVAAADGSWMAALEGDHAVFSSKTNPALQAGNYTLIVPGSPGSATEPGGDGYGTIKMDASGKAQLAVSLADGTKATATAVLSKDGALGVYVPLYRSQGLILSWITFATTPTADLGGKLNWIKPPTSASKYYPRGFTLQTTITGSKYSQPARGTPILSFTDARLVLTGGGLTSPSVNPITLDANNRVTSTNKVRLTFMLSTGTFTGSAPNPTGGRTKTISFGGVVLQKRNEAKGSFLGTTESGEVLLAP